MDLFQGVCGCVVLQVDALRLRLEEKESFLNKKTKQLQDLTEEKGTLAGEIRDMKDMLEVKERKINVLQKKVRVGGEEKLNIRLRVTAALFIVQVYSSRTFKTTWEGNEIFCQILASRTKPVTL